MAGCGRQAGAGAGGGAMQGTFLEPWYWVFAALFWGAVCNSTFGAPNELLMRAGRNEEDARLFDRLARRNLARFGAAIGRRAPYGAAFAGFALALLGWFAWRGSEAATGLFVVAGPAAALSAWGGAAILGAAEAPPAPEALRRLFLRARLAAAGTAAASMLAAVAAAGWRHGPGWTDALFRGF